jgi:hypothetical protein
MEWCGEIVIRYKHASQQCHKDSKLIVEKKTLIKFVNIFTGAPCLEPHHRLMSNLRASRVETPDPLMFGTKDFMVERILLSTIAQETQVR